MQSIRQWVTKPFASVQLGGWHYGARGLQCAPNSSVVSQLPTGRAVRRQFSLILSAGGIGSAGPSSDATARRHHQLLRPGVRLSPERRRGLRISQACSAVADDGSSSRQHGVKRRSRISHAARGPRSPLRYQAPCVCAHLSCRWTGGDPLSVGVQGSRGLTPRPALAPHDSPWGIKLPAPRSFFMPTDG